MKLGRALVGSAILLAAMHALPMPSARAQVTPLCFGKSPDQARAEGYNVISLAGGASSPVPVDGTDGNDFIVGSAAPDQIDGKGGDDLICGKGGDDYLSGGAGSDRVKGGGGNDYIVGDAQLTGSVTSRSSNAVDSGAGGPGNDVLAGGAGNDVLLGNAGDDILRGKDGDDRLDLGSPQTGVFIIAPTGAGADSLDGGAGTDRCPNDPQDAQQLACETGPTQ